MKPITQTDLPPIIQAVRQAAELCRDVQQHYLIENEKAGQEPVTIADYGSQAILCRAISQHFGDDAIIAEEKADQFVEVVSEPQRAQIVRLVSKVLGEPVTEAEMLGWLDHGRGRTAGRTWVIDPIDGTRGFLSMRTYAIAVGVLEGGQMAAAVMGCPGYGEGRICFAAEGAAYMQSLAGGESRRVSVSERTPADVLRYVESIETAHADHARMGRVYAESGMQYATPVRLDGQDKYAMVACGDAELYLRISPQPDYRAKLWDHVAGAALVTAAGGRVTDATGAALDFTQGDTLPPGNVVLATNGRVHDRLLDALHRVGL